MIELAIRRGTCLDRTERLRQQLLQVELLNLKPRSLVMLLEYLQYAGVRQNTPVNQHEGLPVEVDEALQASGAI